MSEPLRVRYDKASDVLYLTTRPGTAARSDESEQPGIIWRYDIRKGDLIGVTVIDFESYWRPRLRELAGEIARRFKLSDIETRDVLSSVH